MDRGAVEVAMKAINWPALLLLIGRVFLRPELSMDPMEVFHVALINFFGYTKVADHHLQDPLPTPSSRQKVEVPSNEKLAIQITDLRLNVLGIELAKMDKEIHKIKTTIRCTATTEKVANGKKRQANQAKKG